MFKESVARHIFVTSQNQKEKRSGITVEPDPGYSGKTPGKIRERVLERKPGGSGLVSPLKELSPDSEMALRVDPGLASFSGPERGIEKRIIVSFATFPPFAFEGVECTDNDGKTIRITPNAPRPPSKALQPSEANGPGFHITGDPGRNQKKCDLYPGSCGRANRL